MESKLVSENFEIEGMTCIGCEKRIENVLKKLDGIANVEVSYSNAVVSITYDENVLNVDKIIKTIEKLNYNVKNKSESVENFMDKSKKIDSSAGKIGALEIVGIAIIILAVYTIAKNTMLFSMIPKVDKTMGYGLLFIVGLLTSFHCIAMCGGINLSVCVNKNSSNQDSKFSRLTPGVLYNLGRVISYTLIGGLVGAIGSAISFSGTAKGVVAIVAGFFMVIMGIKMLNIFHALKKFNIRMPRTISAKLYENSNNHGALYVGLLNGLMPCGPLQTMQLYALGTGSFAAGAFSMFLFSIGTVPLMFGFGAMSSLLSRNFASKMIKVSAVLVMILGIIMLNRGLGLSGVNADKIFSSSQSSSSKAAKVDGDVQIINTKLESGSYPPITVQKGIPVKWTITAAKEDINGCNKAINIPEYNIENKVLVPGDNIIEFTPTKEGNYTYTCWMGMIRSNINVVSDVTKSTDADAVKVESSSSKPASSIGGGGCCGN